MIDPCKQPTVPVVVGPTGIATSYCTTGHCDWKYGPGVKTDVEENARRHRAAHRDLVPATRIVRDVEWDVYCEPCGGHRRTFSTKGEAQAWLDDHLSVEHRLVPVRSAP